MDKLFVKNDFSEKNISIVLIARADSGDELWSATKEKILFPSYSGE